MLLRAQLMLVPFDDALPEEAPCVDVRLAEDGTLTVSRPGGLPRRARLAAPATRRLVHAVAARRLGRLGRCSGVGDAWAVLRTADGARAVRYAGPPGALEPAACRTMPAAFADLLEVLIRAARAVEAGSLRDFADGLPDVLDPAGLLLRWRRSGAAAPAAAPWIAAYADGRVEQWQLDDSLWSGRCVARRRVDPALVIDAAALARQVLGFARPAMGHGHDPTESLSLDVFVDDRALGGSFLWGRASARDAPLAPVSGDGAIAAFDALAERLLLLSIVDHAPEAAR